MNRRRFLGAAGVGLGGSMLLGPGVAQAAGRPEHDTKPLFVGCYTSGTGAGKGIVEGGYDPSGGQVDDGPVATVANPSFLALSPSGRILYSVDEQTDGQVTALARNGTSLRSINSQSSEGSAPTHVSVHPSGRYVLAANYNSGSVVAFPVRPDGGLAPASDLAQHTGSGPDPSRQAGPHAHQIRPDPTGRYLLSVDLGTDSVYVYQLDLHTGKLALRHQIHLRSGCGPRHLTFHPNGRFAYLATELGGTVIVCHYDELTGELRAGQEQPTIAAPVPGVRNYPAEVVVSADGRFVYISNRGANSISIFAVESGGAELRLLASPSCGGDWPRHIGTDPAERFLFCSNQYSSSVTSFAVDRVSGGLTPVGTPLSTPTAVCTLAL